MHLQQLKYVVKVSEMGSFSHASKLLYISQPTLSQQIASLEEELGVKLFLRHSRSVGLTEAGREYVQYARKILNDLEALENSMKNYSSLQKGTLTVGLLWIFGYLGLSELVSGLLDVFPNIDLKVKVNGSSKLLEMLYQREVDVIFVIGSEGLEQKLDLVSQQIMEDRYGVIVSKENSLSNREQLTAEDLDGERLIMPSRDSAFRPQLMDQLQAKRIQPYIVCESSHNDVNIQLVSQNLGMAFMSHRLAKASDNGKFRIVPFVPEMKLSIHYVVLKSMTDYPTVRAFQQYMDGSGLLPESATRRPHKS